jgi:hypothetical protein
MKPQDKKPVSKKVYNQTTRQTGERTGESHECSSDGCNGLRLRVQWPVGGYTFECTSGMIYQQRTSIDKAPYRGAIDICVEAGSWVIPHRK